MTSSFDIHQQGSRFSLVLRSPWKDLYRAVTDRYPISHVVHANPSSSTAYLLNLPLLESFYAYHREISTDGLRNVSLRRLELDLVSLTEPLPWANWPELGMLGVSAGVNLAGITQVVDQLQALKVSGPIKGLNLSNCRSLKRMESNQSISLEEIPTEKLEFLSVFRDTKTKDWGFFTHCDHLNVLELRQPKHLPDLARIPYPSRLIGLSFEKKSETLNCIEWFEKTRELESVIINAKVEPIQRWINHAKSLPSLRYGWFSQSAQTIGGGSERTADLFNAFATFIKPDVPLYQHFD